MESKSLLQGLELSLFLHTCVQTVCLLNKEVANERIPEMVGGVFSYC